MITAKRMDWNPIVAAILRPVMEGDEADIADQVKTGRAELWRFTPNSDTYMVSRLDKINGELEFVLMCLVGSNARGVGEYVRDVCRQLGIKKCVFHTTRPALGRLLSEFNFSVHRHYYVFEAAP